MKPVATPSQLMITPSVAPARSTPTHAACGTGGLPSVINARRAWRRRTSVAPIRLLTTSATSACVTTVTARLVPSARVNRSNKPNTSAAAPSSHGNNRRRLAVRSDSAGNRHVGRSTDSSARPSPVT